MELHVDLGDGITAVCRGETLTDLMERYDRLTGLSVASDTLTNAGRAVPNDMYPHMAEPPADPWAPPSPTSVAMPAAQPSQGQAASYAPSAPPQSQPGVITVQTSNGIQVWSLNPPNGPLCQCGTPAALVRGTTTKGKPYNAYRCLKGSGDDWRNKCAFNQWA